MSAAGTHLRLKIFPCTFRPTLRITAPCDSCCTCFTNKQHVYTSRYADFFWDPSLHHPKQQDSIIGGRDKKKLKGEGGEDCQGCAWWGGMGIMSRHQGKCVRKIKRGWAWSQGIKPGRVLGGISLSQTRQVHACTHHMHVSQRWHFHSAALNPVFPPSPATGCQGIFRSKCSSPAKATQTH